jgi:hypothetical protein
MYLADTNDEFDRRPETKPRGCCPEGVATWPLSSLLPWFDGSFCVVGVLAFHLTGDKIGLVGVFP